jgi:hypothetical protein
VHRVQGFDNNILTVRTGRQQCTKGVIAIFYSRLSKRIGSLNEYFMFGQVTFSIKYF